MYIKKLKCQKLCSKKNMFVLHHPFSKSGHFFAISTKRVTVSVPVSKFTLFHFPASTGRELQPPSSCTSIYVYQYLSVGLQKATTFTLSPGTMFHKFSDWILLVHINTICRPRFIKFSNWTHQ